MVEVEFELGLSDYKQLLSAWLKKEGSVFLLFMKQLLRKLFLYAKHQYLFLRQFNYSKSNIKDHLMVKAAKFFGVDLDESREKVKRRNKPFKSRFRLKDKASSAKKEVFKVKTKNSRSKKVKNKAVNLYRAPE